MKSLLNKNLSQFLLYTTIILITCAPLFFFVMKHYYTEDLDELIEFRSDEFIEERIPSFRSAEIEIWNGYNEDIRILPYSDSYVLNSTVEEFLYNKSEGHNIDYRILYRTILIEEVPYILMSRIPMIENGDLFLNLLFQYGIIFFVLLVALTIVQRVIARKLWSAFYKSLNLIEHYNLEQESIPLFDQTDIREFARLNEILTRLINNNLATYKEQKRFIENASHELQTPLAVFHSKLDMLLQDPDLTQSQSETIDLLYQTSSRLTRLNKNLLLLARIDNYQFKEVEELNVVAMINKQLVCLKELAENSGLTILVEVDEQLVIKANSLLLESLITNLITNAIRHNVEKGTIIITLHDYAFSVTNTGIAEELDSNKIFKRFSRPSEEKKGNGLGLSIVSQIVKFHKWSISYNYQKTYHTFGVCFMPNEDVNFFQKG